MSAAKLADGVVERLGLVEVTPVTVAGDHDELLVRDRLLELACDAERRRASSSPQIFRRMSGAEPGSVLDAAARMT